MLIKEAAPLANAVSAVISDQKGTMNKSTFRGPMRSANHPAGICPRAYAHRNALNIKPTAVLLRLNSRAIAAAATETLVRSMYVIMYITLISIRIVQRVPVAAVTPRSTATTGALIVEAFSPGCAGVGATVSPNHL